MSDEIDEIQQHWDGHAADWLIQVGEQGDLNRILNSDPVLWRFAGDVSGKSVLDAGCGVGYLARQLRDRGAARVTAVDLSPRMIEIAGKRNAQGIEFRVDSCSTLATVESNAYDLVVANYVLMDTPELEAAVEAFHRVLKPGAVAVAIFSHPCFPQGRSTSPLSHLPVTYQWTWSYFERTRRIDAPWGHHKTDFIWFHRPLSDYWKAFRRAGFSVEDFEEPRLEADREHLAPTERVREKSKHRPYSVAFQLRKST